VEIEFSRKNLEKRRRGELLGLFWIEENRMKKWKNELGEKC